MARRGTPANRTCHPPARGHPLLAADRALLVRHRSSRCVRRPAGPDRGPMRARAVVVRGISMLRTGDGVSTETGCWQLNGHVRTSFPASDALAFSFADDAR